MRRAGSAFAIGLAVLAAGCQTAPAPLPYAATMPGQSETLAGCFAEAQGNATYVVSDAPTDRTISVDVNAYQPDGYRVAFTPLADNSTRVSGLQRGGPAPALFWSDQVLPTLAKCAGQMADKTS